MFFFRILEKKSARDLHGCEAVERRDNPHQLARDLFSKNLWRRTQQNPTSTKKRQIRSRQRHVENNGWSGCK
jgi:hypothetical protein